MELDPRLITNVVLIFLTVAVISLTPMYKQGSRGRRALIVGVGVVVVLIVLELVWPRGAPPPWA